ncbi:MAG: hypothetical protein ACRDKZ_10340 [Actinomycetota bacterium]
MSTEEERAARYSDLFESNHDHGSDCAYCPICATIAVVRKTRPEVLEHLASAAREMLVAASILIEEAEQVVGSASPGRDEPDEGPPKVRRIDIG